MQLSVIPGLAGFVEAKTKRGKWLHAGFPHMYPCECTAATTQLCDALNRRHTPRSATLVHPPSAYVTHVVAPAGGELRLDPDELRKLGVQRVLVVDADRKGQVRSALHPLR